MIKKLVYILAGLLLAVALFLALGKVFAGPKDCPPGQDGGCSTYRHKETGKVACFPDNANPEGWIFVRDGCGEKKAVTPTPIPIIFPTPTMRPETKITVVPTKWGGSDDKSKIYPTPTAVILIESPGCSNNDCVCLIVTQLAIGNDLQRTQNDLQRTQIANDIQACTKP